MKKQTLLNGLALAITVSFLAACGGGGGGGSTGGSSGGSTGGSTGGGTTIPSNPSDILQYPYETVFGDVCKTSQPTPGCTFSRATQKRITVSSDPNYDSQGYGSDDLWYVKFDASGNGVVYNDLGKAQYSASVSQFAGFIGGTTIGVGSTGLFWENVSNKTYWFGKNGVLYSANQTASNYGQAINNKDASASSNVNSKLINAEDNQKLIRAGASNLVKKFGLAPAKAIAVASALNTYAVSGAERGKVSSAVLDKAFTGTFGVKFSETLAAFKDYQNGDASTVRELTNRSATSLGLTPEQAQEFIKGMYKGAIEKMGYKVEDIKW